MENKKELIVLESFYTKIKKLIKKMPLKKIGSLVLFFLALYTSTELLNGNYVAFNKIFGFSSSWDERTKYLVEAISYFFSNPKFISAILLYTFSYCIFYGLTKRTKLSCMVISIISMSFSIINHIVNDLRGVAVSISDIFSVGTALNVAKGMKVTASGELVIGLLLFIIITVWLLKFCKFNDKKEEKNKKKRVSLITIGILGIIFIYSFPPIIGNVALWSVNYAYRTYGSGLTIMKMVKTFNIEPPKSYNREEVVNLLAKYNDETIDYSGDLPNVLIVMNESLADLPKVFNIETSGDALSFFHKFMNEENIIKGNMHSSKFGGGTSIVEYEFLTQNITAFLPSGSVPYQQFITKPIKNSIVTYMNNFKYNSYGIHCANGSNYSRSKIYPLLQFNNSVFVEDMDNVELDGNNYATDKYVYSYWKNMIEEKDVNEKNFTFLLTLQKHSPYTFVDENLNQFVQNDTSLNSYMQSLSLSDKALEELIEYLKDYDEDIILLLFGDHQPNLKLEEKYGSNGLYDSDISSHIVPFFIWANYDIEEKSDIDISANYLQGLLFETANLPMDQYTQYVKEVREELPVITTRYYIGKDGVKYMLDDVTSPYYDKLQEYWSVIYYQMFDANED